MIYTVTCNPSLDYIVTVNDFQLGQNEPDDVRTDAYRAGKELMYLQYSKIWGLKIRHLDL